MKPLIFLLFIILNFSVFVSSHDQQMHKVILSSSCPISSPVALERGPPGLPGKRGSKGEKGDFCDPNQCVSRIEIEEIKQTLAEIQRNMSSQTANVATTTTPPTSVSSATSSRNIRNCDDQYNNGSRSNGVYTIYTGQQFVQVYCEFQNGGYNWMVFQKRINGEVDFYLDWDSFANGFGNTNGEFWLGLQALNEITSSRAYRLRIDLEDWEENRRFAEYSNFAIGNNSSNYRLNVGAYSGDAGNGLSHHDNRPFSTKDRDNDAWRANCAVEYQGAWWHHQCQLCNLNARYHTEGPDPTRTGLEWHLWRRRYSMKRASMKIRPE